MGTSRAGTRTPGSGGLGKGVGQGDGGALEGDAKIERLFPGKQRARCVAVPRRAVLGDLPHLPDLAGLPTQQGLSRGEALGPGGPRAHCRLAREQSRALPRASPRGEPRFIQPPSPVRPSSCCSLGAAPSSSSHPAALRPKPHGRGSSRHRRAPAPPPRPPPLVFSPSCSMRL